MTAAAAKVEVVRAAAVMVETKAAGARRGVVVTVGAVMVAAMAVVE